MKIKIIGCGGAFTKKLYNTSFLVTEAEKKLLIDCGRNIPEALYNAGISILKERGINLLKNSTDVNTSESYACGNMNEELNSSAQEAKVFRLW